MKTIETAESTINFKDPLEKVFDSDWITDAFIVDLKKLHEEARINIFSTYADRLLTDTGIGTSLVVNPEYQFTRYADIPRQGRAFENSTNFGPAHFSLEGDKVVGHNIGVGRCYADAIELNRDMLILEFGVPKFTSMLSFYARSADYQKSVIAKEGRDTHWYNVGEVIGVIGQIITLNIASAVVYAGIFALKALAGNGDTRYYHMKPNMPDYWASVSSMLTYLATERGILVPIMMPSSKDRLGIPLQVDSNMLDILHNTMPRVFKKSNYIDVFALTQAAQIKINKQLLKETVYFREGRFTKGQVDSAINEKTGTLDNDVSYEEYLKRLKETSEGYFTKTEQTDQDLPQAESASGDIKDYLTPDKLWTYLKLPFEWLMDNTDEFFETTYATLKHGGQTVNLNVEYVTPGDLSVSNSVQDIPAKSKFIEFGGAARNLSFSTNGGNIFGNTVNDIKKGIQDVAAGALDQITFGMSNVILALTNGGVLDFPKMWSDTSTTLPAQSYKIVATPPYGNPICKIMDMDMILAIMMAGMLPQGVGQSVYQSPRLCKAFLRGKSNVDFGMITSCTIKQGNTNVAFSKDGKALGLEISFTITDFSESMTASVKQSLLGAFGIGLDENNMLNKYLSTYAGRDYHTTRFAFKNGLLQTSRAIMGIDALTTPAYLGAIAGDTLLGKTFGLVTGSLIDTSGIYLSK